MPGATRAKMMSARPVILCWMLLLLPLAGALGRPATPPRLTPAQQELLAERARLLRQFHDAEKQKTRRAAVRQAEEIVRLSRSVYGEVHSETARALELLASVQLRLT